MFCQIVGIPMGMNCAPFNHCWFDFIL